MVLSQVLCMENTALDTRSVSAENVREFNSGQKSLGKTKKSENFFKKYLSKNLKKYFVAFHIPQNWLISCDLKTEN